MFNRNNTIIGVILGCLPPLLLWLIFVIFLKNDAIIMDKPAIPYLIAIAMNLLMLRYCARKHFDLTSRGIMIATFACMLLIAIFKFR
ncbi:hypothetical protein D0C36_23085 [Mucilaginibacter conchicola]|uniref:Stationary phase survival protein SurE n=1 Tax=Mucilaginibacter conchicola TaxID=2303333 RepID=A0A372NND7_9SPHI|nr:hypothetical protein [Mucilaginibacter conchicola]RFZ90127.1 hypothetical protein D0C36_23085 [Mucilaginibacter conchicola]